MIKTLDSGAVLELSVCSFAEGARLMKTVAKEMKGAQISQGDVMNMILSLIASEEIEASLWPCMERGTYTVGGITKKINRDLFEDEKARSDYIPILKEVLVNSLTPFFKSLGSLVKDIPKVSTDIPK